MPYPCGKAFSVWAENANFEGMKHLVAPSILAANFAFLGRDIEMINESEADWIHVDVMDGRFVPNISFGIPVLKDIAPLTNKFLDVHLMIVHPEEYIDAFAKAGAQGLTVQYEASLHLHSILQRIKAAGMKAGVALNPHTPVSVLEDVINDIDLVVIMSVNPGFGGQKFIPNSLKKIKDAKALIISSGSDALIQVDGGVDEHTAPDVLKAGADVLVAGSAVFKADEPKKAISHLKNIAVDTITV